MKSRLLHTPVGVRDIYGDECKNKLIVQKKINDVFASYGYSDIQTPTFEYFDIFNKERGSVASNNMYKFFDREGYTLVLRPDMTPSIARAAAKYYMDEEMPIRFCYTGNAYINNSEYQGKLKEFTQIGCELIGDNTSDDDAEVIVMVIETLMQAGLKEFQIEIGHIGFFKGLVEEIGIDSNSEANLRELIQNKNYFGVEELVKSFGIDNEAANTLLRLPQMFGTVELLDEAKMLTSNKTALDAISRLAKLIDLLKLYDFDKYVSIDLGMLSNLTYYTGIMFKVYTYGTGDAIVNGGRYDKLISQFGKDAPSIGFSITMDRLMAALNRQKIDIPIAKNTTMILYDTAKAEYAILLAKNNRSVNMAVNLIEKDSNKSMDEYIEYCNKNYIGGIVYIKEDDTASVINAATKTCQDVNINDLM
ncbi:MAG: ATP phosphoribosyltransferase regulatory subunit [Lachnospiraceae bacterium]|nr:ATP phosphoribosyltransferase regulatory subunit [Lachnospiraceae bacterium]